MNDNMTPNTPNYSQYVPDVHFEMIPIKNLVSNQDYQRNLSLKHVKRAAANFDLFQINPVKVSRRDNVNYVFNGQHTIEIVATVSGSRDTPVWCMIYDNLDYTHEADIFANQMKYVKSLTPCEIFKANLEAGSDKHIMINELVESFGLVIAQNGKVPGGINAVSALEKIYDTLGYHHLERVLALVVGTWEGEDASLSANMIKALSKLIETYGEELDDELFKERNSTATVKDIMRSAKERHPGVVGVAETLLFNYNQKNRHPLEWNLLYERKKTKKKKKNPVVSPIKANEPDTVNSAPYAVNQ